MLYNIVMTVFEFYSGIILIYVLMSWLPTDRGILADIYNVLGSICEPYLGLFRRIIPPIGGAAMAVDFSPIIALLVLQLIANLVGRFLL